MERKYCLKDEYAERVRHDISKVAIEYQYTYITKKCTVDVEAKTYEYGENAYENAKETTMTYYSDFEMLRMKGQMHLLNE